MAEVSLNVSGQIFKVNKDVLSKHSDYFRAMFSGNYVENDKQEISMDVIDAESMKIILQYMNTGESHLTEYPISTITKLATAANFLNLIEIFDHIETFIESQEILPENCFEIINITQNPAFIDNDRMIQLGHKVAEYAVLAFGSMKPEYIPDIRNLCWYLSHPYIDDLSEVDIFIFGYTWVHQNEVDDDALLLILGCLDVAKLSLSDLDKIRTCILYYQNSLAAKVVNSLHDLAELGFDLSVKSVKSMQGVYSEKVYNETLHLVKESKRRSPIYIPVLLTKNHFKNLQFFTFTNGRFKKWIEYPEIHTTRAIMSSCKNSYSKNVMVMPWGHTKMLILIRSESMMVYDMLKKTWRSHDVDLWDHSYGGAAVLGNSLYLIANRWEHFSTTIYDLKERTFSKIANRIVGGYVQGTIVIVHNGTIYAVGESVRGSEIYAYDDSSKDCWKSVIKTEFAVTHMVSFKSYIFCLNRRSIYRFQPGVDEKLESVTLLATQPTTVCNLGNRIIFFSKTPSDLFVVTSKHAVFVEDYNGDTPNEKSRILTPEKESNITVRDVIGCCPLLMEVPPRHDISKYVTEHLKKYKTLP